MISELNALHAEIDFEKKEKEVIVLSDTDRILYKGGQHWWEHNGEIFDKPISLVWCASMMSHLYLEFRDFGYIAFQIEST